MSVQETQNGYDHGILLQLTITHPSKLMDCLMKLNDKWRAVHLGKHFTIIAIVFKVKVIVAIIE